MEFYRIFDRESSDPTAIYTGGNYHEGRTIAVQDGQPIAVRFWTSWEWGCCPLCGSYQFSNHRCRGTVMPRDYQDWQKGELLKGRAVTMAQLRLTDGGFAVIK